MKLCTKNYENPSIFVKVTAKKSVAPFLSGHGVYAKLFKASYELIATNTSAIARHVSIF